MDVLEGLRETDGCSVSYATISACPKLEVISIDWGSFLEYQTLSISRCDSLTDLSIGGSKHIPGRNCFGHNFLWASEFILESAFCVVVVASNCLLCDLCLFAFKSVPLFVVCDRLCSDLPSLTNIIIGGSRVFCFAYSVRLESESAVLALCIVMPLQTSVDVSLLCVLE